MLCWSSAGFIHAAGAVLAGLGAGVVLVFAMAVYCAMSVVLWGHSVDMMCGVSVDICSCVVLVACSTIVGHADNVVAL